MPTLRVLTEIERQAMGLPSGTCEVTSRGAQTATTHTHGRWRQAKDYLLPPDPSQPGRLSYQMHIGRDIHYEDDGGNWRTIDLDWRADPANPGEFVTDRNDVHTRVTRFGVAVWDRKRKVGVRWSTTVRPTTGGRRATFPKDGLEWSWSATTSGLKLESEPVTVPRGPQTYEWRYLVIDLNRPEGFDLAGTLSVDAGGNLVGDGFVTPRAFVIGANRVRYDCGAWQVVPAKTRAVSFAFDDGALPPEAYPYTIDPTTTFNVAVGADDGYVEATGTTYPPTGSAIAATTGSSVRVTRFFDGATAEIRNALVRWDTSALPDTAVVTAATAQIFSVIMTNTNTRNLTADWYSNWPIDASDYSEAAQTSALAAYPLSSIVNGANSIPLDNTSGVSVTGYTGLRFHISGGTPTGNNNLNFSAFEHPTNAEPRLIIDYTDGAGPTPVTYTVTLSAAAVSVATVTRKHTRTRTLSATLIGSPSLGRVRTAIRRLSAIIVTVPLLVTRKTFRKALAAVATGVATLARAVTYRRALATTMLGAATMPASGAKQQALSVVMTAAATLTRLATFRRTLAVTATALPKLSKRMFVRLSVQATVTATLSWARLRTRALAATAGVVVGMTATFAKGTGFVMRRSLWRAYNLFARTKK